MLHLLCGREVSWLQDEVCTGTQIIAPRQSQDCKGTRDGRGDFGDGGEITEDSWTMWLLRLALIMTEVSPDWSTASFI